MTYNAADRRDIRSAEKAQKLADSTRRTVLVDLCSSLAGRQYLWEQLAATHIFSSTFSADPRQSAFLEGERNVGLRLLNDITTFCPDAFLQMMREHNERSTTAQLTRGARAGRDAEAGVDLGLDDTGDHDAGSEDRVYDS